MSTAESTAHTLRVVRGTLPALTVTQRELVGIFVNYLRSLPQVEDVRHRDQYLPVLALLRSHFDSHRGQPRELAQYDHAEECEFLRLFEGAASPECPETVRLREQKNLACIEEAIVNYIHHYESKCKEVGLAPDKRFATFAASTPLESAALATWGIHSAVKKNCTRVRKSTPSPPPTVAKRSH